MAVTVKTLIEAAEGTTSITTSPSYTAVNCKAIIDKFTAVNTAAANVTLSVYITNASPFVAANNKQVVDARAIAPGETYTFPEVVGQALESGYSVCTVASANTSLTIRASGREIT